MKKIFFTLLLLITVSFAQSQNLLSKKAQISVFTILPGDELYSKFGHSAIRVKDPSRNIDWVFNYGTFDFNTPHFYLKFLKGKLNYMLSVEPYSIFYREYKYEKRSSYEQILNLTQSEKEKIFRFLMWNAQPENRYYLYDFLYDNCATRIRDVLTEQLDDSLILPQRELNTTFRKEIKKYIHNPWLTFGINLLMGQEADRELDSYSAMFLPDYVDSALAQAYVVQPDSSRQPLVSKAHFIYKFERPHPAPAWWYSPTMIFGILLIILFFVSKKEYQKNIRHTWIDIVLFFIIGLAGLILLIMWLFTDHNITAQNWNIAWAFPFHLWFAFAIARQKIGKLAAIYAKLSRWYYLLLIILYWFIPQQLPIASLVLMGILLVRVQLIWTMYKNH